MEYRKRNTESSGTIVCILCFVVQWTWGVLQNLIGLAYFLATLRHKHARFRTSIVTRWRIPFSVGCGMFMFLSSEDVDSNVAIVQTKREYDELVHEYGHGIQSMLLGPLFVPVIAIPSVIWASVPFFQRLRRRKKLSYYWLYCEKWANVLGDKVCQNKRSHF